MTRALILVDLQNDFCPGGALAVTDGDAVILRANALMACYDLVVATQDWHPAGHHSFASTHLGQKPGELLGAQVLWPDHCVQGTPGAAFHPDLDMRPVAAIFRKGMDPAVDSYSGFFDNDRAHTTGLAGWLRAKGVTAVDVVGLATDYCVRFTALDAHSEGFDTRVLTDACRGVELATGDVARALEALRAAGIGVL